LSEEEAGRRLAEYGHNEVPERRGSSLLACVCKEVKNT
jgi:magnesium-transporting ATPase (P-type)